VDILICYLGSNLCTSSFKGSANTIILRCIKEIRDIQRHCMDALDCSLSRVGGAGVGFGDITRATASVSLALSTAAELQLGLVLSAALAGIAHERDGPGLPGWESYLSLAWAALCGRGLGPALASLCHSG
jgi:hypothetical protein